MTLRIILAGARILRRLSDGGLGSELPGVVGARILRLKPRPALPRPLVPKRNQLTNPRGSFIHCESLQQITAVQ